jgi:hypothetical protein
VPAVYDSVLRKYGVVIPANFLAGNKFKWTKRIARLFNSQAKLWDDTVEKTLKFEVAKKASSSISSCFRTECLPVMANFIAALEKALKGDEASSVAVTPK